MISHAGTGSILTALQLGKRPIVVPRRAAHGEHVDGHQDDLAALRRERRVSRSSAKPTRSPSPTSARALRRWRVISVGDPQPVRLDVRCPARPSCHGGARWRRAVGDRQLHRRTPRRRARRYSRVARRSVDLPWSGPVERERLHGRASRVPLAGSSARCAKERPDIVHLHSSFAGAARAVLPIGTRRRVLAALLRDGAARSRQPCAGGVCGDRVGCSPAARTRSSR